MSSKSKKNKLKEYIVRMNKINIWEEKYNLNHPMSEEEKLEKYIEILDLAI